MKSVWVVEDGDYEQRHVVGVYSTAEKAEIVVGQLNSGISDPEYRQATATEYQLDEEKSWTTA